MVFLGNPGTGKTAVAQLVACVLAEIGVLRKGHLVVAKKADLLGRYSNHVSRNTRAIVESAIGGVLLLDEAYALLQGEAELGREVLNVLVDLCYAHKDDLVVIPAGTHTMADLFEANPGLASRFPHKFAFDDYTVDELYSIANGMLVQASFVCADEEARNALSGSSRLSRARIRAAMQGRSRIGLRRRSPRNRHGYVDSSGGVSSREEVSRRLQRGSTAATRDRRRISSS